MPLLAKGIAILVGSFMLAVGINLFLSPFEVLDGGIIGIGLIFHYLWGVKTGLVMIVCSVPIFVLAWFKYRYYFYNSLHGMLVSSLMIDLLEPFQATSLFSYELEPFVSTLLGGLSVGLGIGIMLRFETSTGGTDLLAQFISDKYGINVGIMIFCIDAVVITLGGLLISVDTFLLSVMAITVVGLATSLVTWKYPPRYR